MPIRPDQRWFYPIDWRELSRFVHFERARGCCEPVGDRTYAGYRRWTTAYGGTRRFHAGATGGAGAWRSGTCPSS